MSMSIDGLISGMDTTSLVTQLLRAEAAPQTQLKAKLAKAETQASAYRTINTTFAAVRAAAEALTTSGLGAARKATPSAEHVTASAGAAAADGASVTFSVVSTARAQSQVSTPTWSGTASWSDSTTATRLEFRGPGGTVAGSVDIPAGATLGEVATLINGSDAGVKATVLQPETGTFQLMLTSSGTGSAGVRNVVATDADGAAVPGLFRETRPAENAVLDLGDRLTSTSSTNTFTDLIPGVSVTVSKPDAGLTTVTVGQDASGIATKMQTLVDAVNSAITTARDYTRNEKGSTAALKGDFNISQLAGQLLQAVSRAVEGHGSPAQVGLQLTKDGTRIAFDKDAFTTALTANPELAQRIVGGGPATAGADEVLGNADDLPVATGVATRLFDVAKAASDNTTGSILALAKGKDSTAADLKGRIESWDLRLERRKEILTRQFSAMETALSGLRNQSTWLAGQLNSLPSSS